LSFFSSSSAHSVSIAGFPATPEVTGVLLICPPDELPVASQIPKDIVGEKIAMRTRKARLCDADAIYQLVDGFSYDGTLLHRSHMEICENIETFTIVETDLNEFIGCAALHVYGPHLAEVRSIVVRVEVRGMARAVCSFDPSFIKPKKVESNAFVSLHAFQTFSSTSVFGPSNTRPCATRY
jgi:hypothetical protein